MSDGGKRTPLSTYRVQLRPGFGFDEAAGLADYLADLGVTHLYASPYLQAAPGSTHGYDVVDHSRVNDELGGSEAHARLCDALSGAGLGQVLDVVPNHMAITGRENAWWWDVLENGPASVYASYFDVTWDPPEAKLRNTVLMPILDDHYGRVLEAGELRLERYGAEFTVRYDDHVLPVAPRSLEPLLSVAARASDSDDLAFIAHSYGRLPPAARTDASSVQERHRDKEVLHRELARLCEGRPEVATAIDEVIATVNDDVDALDALLERQNYRVAYWRTAGRELDYRRFFDINTLVGLRVEDAQVFDDTHRLVVGWLRAGVLDGLRIDHPDGLRDPEGYFRRLEQASDGAWVAAEKILEPDEHLPESWPIAGTTGYDFLNRTTGVLLDHDAEEAFTQLYVAFTGDAADEDEVVYRSKSLVLRDVLGADLNRLAALFVDVCERQRRYRDFTRHDLHDALREVIACFPVYRTYVRLVDGRPEVSTDDVRYVGDAIQRARKRRPDLDGELLDFLGDLLVLKVPGELEAELAFRFQQLTGPAMAKGVEDTAFYLYSRFVVLNEVGGDPGRFGIGVDQFHDANVDVQAVWPTMMVASSTHDTKRSEDVRARLAVLSEIPDEWGDAVRRWTEMVDSHWPQG